MTSPKDVIILIDSSGSVKGPTKTALVWSIKEILKTLGPNDFMNMVLFNKNVELINSCKELFQATPRNKQVMQYKPKLFIVFIFDQLCCDQ